MIRVQLSCSARTLAVVRCPVFESEPVKADEVDGWISAAVEEHGWITVGEQHFCPDHEPGARGNEVTVRPGKYTEIAPGVRVRLPPDMSTFELTIEVQTQDRECHGCVGGVCGGGNGVYEPGTEWSAWHSPDEKGR